MKRVKRSRPCENCNPRGAHRGTLGCPMCYGTGSIEWWEIVATHDNDHEPAGHLPDTKTPQTQ